MLSASLGSMVSEQTKEYIISGGRVVKSRLVLASFAFASFHGSICVTAQELVFSAHVATFAAVLGLPLYGLDQTRHHGQSDPIRV